MKQLIGKTIESLEELSAAGLVKVNFDDETSAVISIMVLPSEMGAAEPAPAKKEEKKPSAKKEEKGGKKAKVAKPTDWEDIEDLDHEALAAICKAHDLDTDPEDFDEDDAEEVEDFKKAIAEELDIEVPKASKGKKEEKEPALTWDDLKDMDSEELTDLIEDEKLDVDADDFDDDEAGLREAIAKEMEIEIPKKKKK